MAVAISMQDTSDLSLSQRFNVKIAMWLISVPCPGNVPGFPHSLCHLYKVLVDCTNF